MEFKLTLFFFFFFLLSFSVLLSISELLLRRTDSFFGKSSLTMIGFSLIKSQEARNVCRRTRFSAVIWIWVLMPRWKMFKCSNCCEQVIAHDVINTASLLCRRAQSLQCTFVQQKYGQLMMTCTCRNKCLSQSCVINARHSLVFYLAYSNLLQNFWANLYFTTGLHLLCDHLSGQATLTRCPCKNGRALCFTSHVSCNANISWKRKYLVSLTVFHS